MKVILSNNIHLADLNADQYHALIQNLSFENPKYKEAVQYGRSVRKIPEYLQLYEMVPDGLIIPRGISVDWLDSNVTEDLRHTHPVTIETNIKPREYQEQTIKQALDHTGGVIVAPTGSGKTVTAIEMAGRLGQRCLILVKSIDLAKQWQAAIKQFTGLECGLIGGGKKKEGTEFTVALIQSLVKRGDNLDYGLVIADECHNIPAAQAYKVINRQAAKYRYGLSATPQRRDNLEFMIEAALGPVIAEVKKDQLTGAVLPVKVATLRYDFKGHPDSWAEFIELLALDIKRNRLLVEKAIKSSQVIGTVVLTATVSHAEELHKLILEQGAVALLIHGKLTNKEREKRINEAPSAQLIIGTLSLLSEGIDWPHIGGIVFASPVSAATDKDKPAATRLIQSIGRARRPFPGKTHAYVLDVIDNHPFGISVFKKRMEIYDREGFTVH